MTGTSYQTGSSLPFFCLSFCRADLIWEIPLHVPEPSLTDRIVMFRGHCAGHTTRVSVLSLFGLILTNLLATAFAKIPLFYTVLHSIFHCLSYCLAMHFSSSLRFP